LWSVGIVFAAFFGLLAVASILRKTIYGYHPKGWGKSVFDVLSVSAEKIFLFSGSEFDFFNFWFSSEKVGDFIKVLCTKPRSLTRYGLRHVWYNTPATTGDRRAQECDPSTVAVSYGMGLVSSLIPTLYDYAGCCNAINSSPQS